MTRMVETLIDGDPQRYEQRYTIRLCNVPQRFVRRPIAVQPPDGTVALVDGGPRRGSIERYDGALFRGGKWCRTKMTVSHWTVADE